MAKPCETLHLCKTQASCYFKTQNECFPPPDGLPTAQSITGLSDTNTQPTSDKVLVTAQNFVFWLNVYLFLSTKQVFHLLN